MKKPQLLSNDDYDLTKIDFKQNQWFISIVSLFGSRIIEK